MKKLKKKRKRGLRSATAIAERKQKRSAKRRVARRLKRKNKSSGQNTEKRQVEKKSAKAQEPIKIRMKLQLGRNLRIATLNIRGTMKPGVRDEVERWMTRQNIMIARIQETRSKQNTRESRKQYTWFFSGEGGREEYTAGVAIIINNKYLQYVKDIEPIDDRLMYLTLNGRIDTTIIVTYMPPSDRPNIEKTKAYDNLQKITQNKQTRDIISNTCHEICLAGMPHTKLPRVTAHDKSTAPPNL